MDPETGDYYEGSVKGSSFNSTGKPPSPSKKRATPPYSPGNSRAQFASDSGGTAIAASKQPDDIQRTALLRSIRDIDWMVQQGLISGAEAQAKKNEAVDNMLFKSDLKVPLVDGQLRQQPQGGGKQGKSFLGSFLSGSGSLSIGGSGASQSQDWTPNPSSSGSPSSSFQGTTASASQAQGVREGPVMHSGKPAILHADSEMISVLDPRTREARKQWLLTGNFVSCSEKEDRTSIASIGGLNKRLSRSFTAGATGATSGAGGGAALEAPFDQKGPWFPFTVSIGKTKVSLSAPSIEERAAWVQWFMDTSQQPRYRGRINSSGNISAALAHLPRA